MDYRRALIDAGVDATTVDIFIDWHQEHRHIWQEFELRALMLLEKGVGRFGAKAIVEAIRYDAAVYSGSDYKINNNYPAYYARIFAIKHPQHQDFFEYRIVKGLKGES